MNSHQYIENKLQKLVKEFPQITLLYEFDEVNETHVVEVSPLSVYENNNSYMEAEGDLTFDFDQRFFPEEIMFVSEDSLTRVTNPQKVFKNESPAYWEEFEMTEPHLNNQPIHLCYKGSASLPKSNTVNNTR
ncbi:MAG: hypothetical protein EOM83_11340 [Clostridia bacterium]|nr:hypothetical protein [Clostridia bacterium]